MKVETRGFNFNKNKNHEGNKMINNNDKIKVGDHVRVTDVNVLSKDYYSKDKRMSESLRVYNVLKSGKLGSKINFGCRIDDVFEVVKISSNLQSLGVEENTYPNEYKSFSLVQSLTKMRSSGRGGGRFYYGFVVPTENLEIGKEKIYDDHSIDIMKLLEDLDGWSYLDKIFEDKNKIGERYGKPHWKVNTDGYRIPIRRTYTSHGCFSIETEILDLRTEEQKIEHSKLKGEK